MAFLQACWALLTSRLAGPIAAGAALALGLALIASQLTLATTKKDLRAERAAITAPVTGWAARLATCQSNAASTEGALKDQNNQLASQKKAVDQKLAAAEQLAAVAARGRARAEASVSSLLAFKPAADECKAFLEADALVLEQLR